MKTLRDYIDIVARPQLTESLATGTQVTLLEAHEFCRLATNEERAILTALVNEGRTLDAQRVMRHVNGIELDEGLGKWMRNAATAGAIGLGALGALPAAHAAEPVQQTKAPAVQQVDSAQAVTQQLMDLGSGADFQKWMATNLNFAAMAKQIAGDKWDQANPQQRQELVKAVQDLINNKYGSKISFLKGKTFDLKPSPEVGGKSMVNGQMKGFWLGDIDLGFKMEKVGGQWKINDIVARGSSIVDGLQKSYNSAQNIDELIKTIRTA